MTSSTDTLTFTRPDDWHLHVRDGARSRPWCRIRRASSAAR
jgi:dihydroorotase